MAFEGASEMAGLIAAHKGQGVELRTAYLRAFHGRFKSRLTVSGLIRYAAYRPTLSTAAVRLLSASKALRLILARQTRSTGQTTGG
jgi:hypothetical protein